jgi:adenylate cyclase, class 2
MTDGRRRNHELKAREPDLALAAERCAAIGAVPQGTMTQLDTYFDVTHGKLKLREYGTAPAELIQYQRADGKERLSNYRVIACAEPAVLRAALTDALGVRVSVQKTRRLFLWRGVRIHLDDVAGLGTFVELEAPIGDDRDDEASALIAELRAALQITDERLVTDGYADQLIRKGAAAPGVRGGEG